MPGFSILTVTQITSYLKSYIDENKKLSGIYIKGEITDFKANFYSGHFYFSLKDASSEISCVMFKSYAERIRFMPKDGMSVIIRCDLSVYQKSCSCQLYVYDIQPDGLGAKYLAFEQLKEKLEKEGLFDEKYKKALPAYPEKIGVITSESGAAIQDIINVLKRRWPIAKIVLTPAAVQGEDAAAQLISTVEKQNNEIKPDVIIIGRGGGSSEDLSAFNDEKLARAIFECEIPVISAVGHETDFSICDFVADMRAPTPSAAAELASPDSDALRQSIDRNIEWMKDVLDKKIAAYEKLFAEFSSDKLNGFTERRLNKKAENLSKSKTNLVMAYKSRLSGFEYRFIRLLSGIEANNPAKMLKKNFCLAEINKKPIRSIDQVEIGQEIDVFVSDGSIRARVIGKTGEVI